MSSMTMFTIPADFKESTIETIMKLEAEFPHNKVIEVYGSLNSKYYSGRGNLQSAPNVRELHNYICRLSEAEINFRYTFNALCYENKELDPKGLEEMLYFISDLEQIGIKNITVASPVLLEYFKKVFPNIHFLASAIMGINSVTRAKKAISLGADRIVLHEDITRNLGLVKAIANKCDRDVEIITNMMCINNCIYRRFHYNSLSHDTSNAAAYYGLKCGKAKNECNLEYIRSLWIRPEDIDIYKDLGVKVFKIIGREIATEMNFERVLRAYFSRYYDGNLLDLLYGFTNTGNTLYINNRQLDGFINHFKEGYFCSELDCESCNYCLEFMEKSILR